MRLVWWVRSCLSAIRSRWLAAVLVLGSGDADDAPEVALAVVVTDQHVQELRDVESIALGSPRAGG
jgi:hypothetical protein